MRDDPKRPLVAFFRVSRIPTSSILAAGINRENNTAAEFQPVPEFAETSGGGSCKSMNGADMGKSLEENGGLPVKALIS